MQQSKAQHSSAIIIFSFIHSFHSSFYPCDSYPVFFLSDAMLKLPGYYLCNSKAWIMRSTIVCIPNPVFSLTSQVTFTGVIVSFFYFLCFPRELSWVEWLYSGSWRVCTTPGRQDCHCHYRVEFIRLAYQKKSRGWYFGGKWWDWDDGWQRRISQVKMDGQLIPLSYEIFNLSKTQMEKSFKSKSFWENRIQLKIKMKLFSHFVFIPWRIQNTNLAKKII